MLQEAESDAGVEEAREGLGVAVEAVGEVFGRGGGGVQVIEDSERCGGEHGFGAAEGLDEVEDGGWIGRRHITNCE